MKKIVIIHYNTQELTEALIKSINKHVDDVIVYVFDNSDKKPFINNYDNVKVIDNTKGAIVDFDEFLNRYPDRYKSHGATNQFGSAKHCISVQKCMDILDEPFVLLDSDVLLKRDISDLYSDKMVFVSGIAKQNHVSIFRVLPFICYINVPLCKKNGITFFDDRYMHGLMTSKDGDRYDTGASFFLKARKHRYKEINIDNYIIHFKGGSWEKDNNSQEKWLTENSRHWESNRKVVYTCITGGYDTLKKPSFLDDDFDYVCFTDDMSLDTYGIWELRNIPDSLDGLSNVKKQRSIKICPHKYLGDYDISIWVDGNITITSSLNELLGKTLVDGINIYIPAHPKRTCIYEEAVECERLKKDSASNIKRQVSRYSKEGFPHNYGLPQSNIIVRRHNEEDCIRLMEMWCTEVVNESHRDQLSFSYCLWKNPDIRLKYMPKNIDISGVFNKKRHVTDMPKPKPIEVHDVVSRGHKDMKTYKMLKRLPRTPLFRGKKSR